MAVRGRAAGAAHGRFNAGASVTLLDWRSQAGTNFKPDAANEAVRLSVADPASARTMSLDFALLDARNNWWWAFDNLLIDAEVACSADFNPDGDTATDQDIEAFFRCPSGSCCPTCPPTADFNGDGDIGPDADIESFFRVLAGGAC